MNKNRRNEMSKKKKLKNVKYNIYSIRKIKISYRGMYPKFKENVRKIIRSALLSNVETAF
jgi:hypothetical protein